CCGLQPVGFWRHLKVIQPAANATGAECLANTFRHRMIACGVADKYAHDEPLNKSAHIVQEFSAWIPSPAPATRASWMRASSTSVSTARSRAVSQSRDCSFWAWRLMADTRRRKSFMRLTYSQVKPPPPC